MSANDEHYLEKPQAMHFEFISEQMYRFEVIKSGQHFLFSCQRGQEKLLLEELSRHANDQYCVLDWFDVAIFSHQMGERLARQLEKLFDCE